MRTSKLKTLLYSTVITLGTITLLAFTSKADDPIDKLVAALQKWYDDNPQEKVYLQLDKPYYALGDTIWFKGYVMTGSRHQLSAVSGSLYVDLINDRDSVIRNLKLPLTTGMAMGDLTLGDGLTEGNYRLRAYTQWMRNAGEEYFFDRTFTVGSILNDNIITKSAFNYVTEGSKTMLNAKLKYTDVKGTPLANTDVLCRIYIDKKLVWTKNTTTDANGDLLINIDNDKKVNLAGAYIRTVLKNNQNKTVTRDIPIKASLLQSDVQFFPEGGNLVSGIITRVGFKVLGVDGLGQKVSGKVVDNAGNEVANISTQFAGMGSFILRPIADKNYSAIINFADGSTKTLPLPKSADQGYVLNVLQPKKDSVLVRINASAAMVGQNVNFVAQTRGETIYASGVKIKSGMTSIWLAKKDFPSGIAQFTIFNNAGDPLNERVAFIKGNDQLQLNIKTKKPSYNSREPVFMELMAKGGNGQPVVGNFSVSVVDESKLPVEEDAENSILANTLLTSDIKGYIEKPNHYFAKNDDQTAAELDNLMLTQGYRRFVWKDVVAGGASATVVKPRFVAEGLGFAVSGTVYTLGHKPAPNALVRMISRVANVSLLDTSDANGRFKFGGIFLTDSIKFAVQARTMLKNSDKLILELDTLPKLKLNKNPNFFDLNTDISGTMKEYIATTKKQDEAYEKAGMFDKVQRLREVKINALRNKPEAIAPQGMFRIPEGHADQTMKLENPEGSGTLLEAFMKRMPAGTRLEMGQTGNYQLIELRSGMAMQFILNGRRITSGDEIQELLTGGVVPTDVVRVEVVRTSLPLLSILGGPSVMIITKAVQTRLVYSPNIVNISPKGFNKAREFYMPKYGRPGENTAVPNLRTTIYWNPYLKTGVDGKAVMSFFNADGPGNYKVIVEGIDAEGQLGRQIFRYTVSGDPALLSAGGGGIKVDGAAAPLLAAYDSLQRKFPAEKVYLHTDKPYYNLTDTLWFKSYLTDAALKASKKSSILYVELNDDSTEVVRRIAVPIKDGQAYGQIELTPKIFHEGGYTLRAYTNWMQNFGEDVFFTQRFYLGVPAKTAWLVKSTAFIDKAEEKDRVNVDLRLNFGDKKPIALRDVEVKIYEGRYYIYKEKMRTGIDGSLKIIKALKDKLDGRNLRVEVTSLDKADNNKRVQVPLTINRASKTDLQFLPEGGNLVAGLKSVVGFKAIGEDGKGTEVSGIIQDAVGKQVAEFSTMHNGMGRFEFTPNAGQVYTAKLTKPEGVTITFPMPKVNQTGTVLHVENSEQGENITVTIAGLDKMPAGTAYYLTGTAAGRVCYSQTVDAKQNTFNIAKDLFPAGIAHFTLLKDKLPVNDRLVFIEHQAALTFKIKPDRTSYKKRDSMSLSVEVTDQSGMPVKGNFSLAVTDNSQVRPDLTNNNGAAAGLLLRSDLKGYIEEPGYYFDRGDKQSWSALDNLMLTQGWSGFDWRNVFEPVKEPKFVAEKEFKVSGTVVNAFNKPVIGGQVILSSQKPNLLLTEFADANGRFAFKDLPKIDSGSFFIQAKNAKGNDMIAGGINLDKFVPPRVPETFRNAVMPWYVNSDTTQLNYVTRVAQMQDDAEVKTAGTLLKNVTIKTSKVIPDSHNPYGPGMSDLAFDEKDIRESGTMNLWQLLKQKLPGLTLTNSVAVDFRDARAFVPQFMFGKYSINRSPTKPMFINPNLPGAFPLPSFDLNIDGWPVLIKLNTGSREEIIEELSQIQVATLKGLEVMYNKNITNRTIQGSDGKPITGYRPYEFAIIEITTKSGVGYFKNNKPGSATYRPLPVAYPQAFYVPKYKVDQPIAGMPDYRSTIFWEPNLITDANGQATLSFSTSDLPNNYSVNMQGVTADGYLGGTVQKLNTTADKQLSGKISTPPVVTGLPAAAMAIASGNKADMGKVIISSLDTLRKRLPVEKVYLHTDKPNYSLGDTLWFKSYVTDASGKPSKLSGLLYVELNDDSISAVRRISIPIKDGIGRGQIPLKQVIFHDGNYTLRAYTNWQQNLGESYYFNQRFYLGVPSAKAWLVNSSAAINKVSDRDQLNVDIKLKSPDGKPIGLRDMDVKIYEGKFYLFNADMRTGVDGSLKFSKLLKDKVNARLLRVQLTSLDKADKGKVVQVPLDIARDKKIDLQFLPEGGNLVAGLKSTIGFKAIGEDGLGKDITGAIYDSKNTKIADLKSNYKGIGRVELTPAAGEVYVAKIVANNNLAKTYRLPVAIAAGTVMHLEDQLSAEAITINLQGLNNLKQDSDRYLIGTSDGKVCYSQRVDGSQPTLSVNKNLFPTGVARFTLLKDKRPINERVVFIDHQDKLNITAFAQKMTFNKRDSVSLTIEVKDKNGMPVKGNFSLAVTDNSQVKADTTGDLNIAANLLLKSGLKGTIEDPGYYFKRRTEATRQALDDLMLTQGWVGYDWKDAFTDAPVSPKFIAEKELTLRGTVINVFKKPLPNASVMISSQKPSFVANALTDANGRFAFTGLPVIDSGSFFFQANNKKGKHVTFGDVKVDRSKFPEIPATDEDVRMPWYVNSDKEQLNYVARVAQRADYDNIIPEGTLLSNVSIKNVKKIKDSYHTSGSYKPTAAYDEQDFQDSGVQDLYQFLKQKIPGFKAMRDWKFNEGRATLKIDERSQCSVKIRVDGPDFLPLRITDSMSVDELIDELSSYKVATFRGIEVFGDPRSGCAWVGLTTKNKDGWFKNVVAGTDTYRPLPLMQPQRFYDPQYKANQPVTGVPDYRSTIFWEPNVYTDVNGKARVTFHTSDLPANYNINIQGLTLNGEMGSLITKMIDAKKGTAQQ